MEAVEIEYGALPSKVTKRLDQYPESKLISNVKMSMKMHDFVSKCGVLLTIEARARAQGSPFRICGIKVALGQVFLRALWLFPVSIIPPLLHIH
jgi:hypothetical protein